MPAIFDFTVRVAQLVRALDCGSRGRGFESPLSPLEAVSTGAVGLFCALFRQIIGVGRTEKICLNVRGDLI